nr:hypothetical protein [uncultured bacterium]
MSKLPSSILKYFWGDRLDNLSWEKHKDYIAKTLLEKGDKESINWLFGKLDRNYLKKLVKNQRLGVKSKNFWEIYLS